MHERYDIAIVDADKTRSITIACITDYIEKSEIQLNKKQHYHQSSKDQIELNNKTVNKVKARFQKGNLITKTLSEGFKSTSPCTPRICI